jgi:hypothetical protein
MSAAGEQKVQSDLEGRSCIGMYAALYHTKLVTFLEWLTYVGRMMTDDMKLVPDYAQRHSEEAFAALVARHVRGF